LVPEQVKDRLAKRQASAAVALLRLGRDQNVWPILQHLSSGWAHIDPWPVRVQEVLDIRLFQIRENGGKWRSDAGRHVG